MLQSVVTLVLNFKMELSLLKFLPCFRPMQFFSWLLLLLSCFLVQLNKTPNPDCTDMALLLHPMLSGKKTWGNSECVTRHQEHRGPVVQRPNSPCWQPERTNISGKTSCGGRDGKDNIWNVPHCKRGGRAGMDAHVAGGAERYGWRLIVTSSVTIQSSKKKNYSSAYFFFFAPPVWQPVDNWS